MEDYTVVFRATDESTGNIIKLALEGEGIEAVVQPLHTSWLDGAMVSAEGIWGVVLVPDADAEKATALIADYDASSSDETEES